MTKSFNSTTINVAAATTGGRAAHECRAPARPDRLQRMVDRSMRDSARAAEKKEYSRELRRLAKKVANEGAGVSTSYVAAMLVNLRTHHRRTVADI